MSTYKVVAISYHFFGITRVNCLCFPALTMLLLSGCNSS